jgi:hypothetical protein
MASLTGIAAGFRGFLATSIPQIIDLLQDDGLFVRNAVYALSDLSKHGMSLIWSGMVPLTSIAAEFQRLIATSIPQIINLLKDDFACVSAGIALSEFSKYGMLPICSGMAPLTSIAAEFRELIATSIPHIIDLLDDYETVHWSTVDALSGFSAHGMSPICSGMAPLTSIAAEFRELIATSIPHIIDLLDDDDETVRCSTVDALSDFSAHGM